MANDSVVGMVVTFWEWNDQGVEQMLCGTVESEFTDPEDVRSSFHVREPNGRGWTPYSSDCRPVEGDRLAKLVEKIGQTAKEGGVEGIPTSVLEKEYTIKVDDRVIIATLSSSPTSIMLSTNDVHAYYAEGRKVTFCEGGPLEIADIYCKVVKE